MKTTRPPGRKGRVGRDLDGMAQQGEGSAVLATLMLQHAHVVENVGPIRPALEQCGVDHLRVVELVEPIALDRQRERLRRREGQLTLRRGGGAHVVGAAVGHGGDHPPAARPRRTSRARRRPDRARRLGREPRQVAEPVEHRLRETPLQVSLDAALGRFRDADDLVDISKDTNVLVATTEFQPLAFFDVDEVVRVAEAPEGRVKRYLQWRLSEAMFNRLGYLARFPA